MLSKLLYITSKSGVSHIRTGEDQELSNPSSLENHLHEDQIGSLPSGIPSSQMSLLSGFGLLIEPPLGSAGISTERANTVDLNLVTPSLPSSPSLPLSIIPIVSYDNSSSLILVS